MMTRELLDNSKGGGKQLLFVSFEYRAENLGNWVMVVLTAIALTLRHMPL